MADKRKRMVLNSEDMPDEVYRILDSQSAKRALTPYVVALVQKSLESNLILEKLSIIENKIDNISVVGVINNGSSNDIEEKVLNEGIILDKFTDVKGGIDEEDKKDYDY